MTNKELISTADAAHEVMLVSRRLALLHLAFSRTAIHRLGEEEGRQFILEAIKEYGTLIGEEVRTDVEAQGLSPDPDHYGAGSARGLPNIGMHEGVETVEVDGQKRLRAYGCVMGKVWHEYGEDRLGRLYCFVDPAKYMAYNPSHTLAHIRALPDGAPYCEFCVRQTTAEEREAFKNGDPGWESADRCS